MTRADRGDRISLPTNELSTPQPLSVMLARRLPAVARCTLPVSSVRRLASLAKGPSPSDSFANGTNAYYADEMYRLWKRDPKSVHPSWNVYFSGLANGLASTDAFQPPPTMTTHHLPHPAGGAPALHVGQGAQLDDHLKVCDSVLYVLDSTVIHMTGTTSCPCIPSPWPSSCRA